MRGERERAKQQQSIGQVQRKINRACRGTIVSGEPQQNQQGAQQRLVEDEQRRCDHGNARQMSRHRAAEYPHQQEQDRDDGDAAHHAVGELDQSGQPRMGLHHDPVAQRPMIATAGAGAGGTDHGAP